jgi:hypothetical protein
MLPCILRLAGIAASSNGTSPGCLQTCNGEQAQTRGRAEIPRAGYLSDWAHLHLRAIRDRRAKPQTDEWEAFVSGRIVMTKPSIGVLLLFAVAVFAGCGKGRGEVKESAAAQPVQTVSATPQPSSKPSHLSFRGLHADQSQNEVWATVKANAADADFLNIVNDPKTNCDLDKGSGYVFCDGGHSSLVFSREHKLIKFQVSIFNHGDNSEEFFTALRKELAADNGGESTEGSATFPIGENPLPKFTWRTDQTVGGCFDDPKGDCPSETIVYLEQRPTRADIEFTDNAYFKR